MVSWTGEDSTHATKRSTTTNEGVVWLGRCTHTERERGKHICMEVGGQWLAQTLIGGEPLVVGEGGHHQDHGPCHQEDSHHEGACARRHAYRTGWATGAARAVTGNWTQREEGSLSLLPLCECGGVSPSTLTLGRNPHGHRPGCNESGCPPTARTRGIGAVSPCSRCGSFW